jgi:hypothetical protein
MLCPLCLKECETINKDKIISFPSFRCSTRIEVPGREAPASHFVRFPSGGWSTGEYYEENAILMPYRLDNHYNSNVTGRIDSAGVEIEIIHKPTSHIYAYGTDNREKHPIMASVPRNLRFNHVLRTPLIHMDIEERLRQRLKLILLLS